MPKTLLLADDSPTTHRVVELTFAGEDVRVVSVGDGDQAIEAIRRTVPDVVLADIDMPGRSGFEVTQFIRSQAASASVPVLLLAGKFEPVDQDQAHQAGADGILTKPFDPAVLVSRVMELLTGGRGTSPVVHVHPPSPSAAFRSTHAIETLTALESAVAELAPDTAAAPSAPVPDAEVAALAPMLVPTTDVAAPVVETTALVEAELASDDYFDQIDQAFAALSKNPRPPLPIDEDASSPLDDDRLPTAAVPDVAPRTVPLTDAFSALLDAERAAQPDPALRVVPSPAVVVTAPAAAPSIDVDALADQIASRVLAQLSDRIVRETVADITSATAERLVREEIERIKRHIK